MSVSRASLIRGPAKVTFGGATFYTTGDIVATHAPVWEAVSSSLHGQSDKFKRDMVIKVPLTLFGNWASMSVLFPSALLNPVPGTAVFGASDSPLVIHAKNNDMVTYHNAAITKLADLRLGVDGELFEAQVEFTVLIANSANPEDAAAYFTRATSAYSETGFSLTNFKKARWTAAWGTKTGFTSFTSKDAFHIAWGLDLQADTVDGLGTVSMYVGPGGMVAACRCIPIGPTAAQVDTEQGVGVAHGSLLSASGTGGVADLTITAGAASVVLLKSGIVSSSTAFGIQPLRVGEVTWETTRGFTTGTQAGVATVT